MAEIVIQKGYDLKIAGEPESSIADAPFPHSVGVRPANFKGIKPKVLVEEGDEVKIGTPLLEAKDCPDVKIVSPATGKVNQVRRGPRRVLLDVSVEASGDDVFEEIGAVDVEAASRDDVKTFLLRAGLWPLLIQHPFAKIANPSDAPKAVFVSALQSEPFHPDPNVILEGDDGAFQIGLNALAKLTDGAVHLSRREGSTCQALANATNVAKHTVSGPHPAGSGAVQAFYIDRVKPGEVAWYLDAEDVQMIGRSLRAGHFVPDRVVSLGGNGVRTDSRMYYRTRLGASVDSIVADRLEEGDQRIISGGVLSGAAVDPDGFLGYYDKSINVVPEGNKRSFLGWLTLGSDKNSWSHTFASALASEDKRFEVDTNLNGGVRACIQSGYCLEVCPTDVQPLFVWKAVSYGDLEEAEQLGILDCTDCGLCTFVCPSKIEIGSIIHKGLDQIEKEG